jgi:hypothetical protein
MRRYVSTTLSCRMPRFDLIFRVVHAESVLSSAHLHSCASYVSPVIIVGRHTGTCFTWGNASRTEVQCEFQIIRGDMLCLEGKREILHAGDAAVYMLLRC